MVTHAPIRITSQTLTIHYDISGHLRHDKVHWSGTRPCVHLTKKNSTQLMREMVLTMGYATLHIKIFDGSFVSIDMSGRGYLNGKGGECVGE